MPSPVRVVPPAELPVSLDEFKRHLRVDFADDDALLNALLAAAVDYLDGWTGVLGRCMVTQQWRIARGVWFNPLALPFPGVTAASIVYADTAGTDQTIAASLYELVEDAGAARIEFKSGFAAPALQPDRADAIRVTLTAGYGAASAVPAALKLAVQMLAARWYEAGAVDAARPAGIDDLIAPFRRRP